MIKPKIILILAAFSVAVFQAVIAADMRPMVEYYVDADYYGVNLERVDWGVETRGYGGGMGYDDHIFAKDIYWWWYDQNTNRVFFDDSYPTPHFIFVCDFKTNSMLKLPFANYSGGDGDFLISANSKHIVLSYRFQNYDSASYDENFYKTVVLDGKTLDVLSERIGISFLTDSVPKMAYISGDGNFLFTINYLPILAGGKSHAIVTYTLPALNAIDTTFLLDLGWNGPKGVSDLSGTQLLIRGRNNDDPSLSPGRYMFVWDGVARKIVTPFIPVDENDEHLNLITPAGDEVVLIGKTQGTIKRYSIPDGNFLGETDISRAIWGAFFRSDGNLYLRQADVRGEAVVDYKNNRLVKTIIMPAID